jgi:hypothetical protein
LLHHHVQSFQSSSSSSSSSLRFLFLLSFSLSLIYYVSLSVCSSSSFSSSSSTPQSPSDPEEAARFSPGPKYDLSKGIQAISESSPKYSMVGRHKDHLAPKPLGPGPAYSPNPKAIEPASAVPTITGRPATAKPNLPETPHAYDVKDTLAKTLSPSFSMTHVSHQHPDHREAPMGDGTPAPGAHSPKYDYVKPSTPGVKFAGRHKPVEDGAVISPGPAAYGPILTSPLMKRSPSYSLKGRPVTPIDIAPPVGPGPAAYAPIVRFACHLFAFKKKKRKKKK